ncbi:MULTISPECIES: hypothetical protein [unclassified Tenacibaculum]|uniref:hypothetical protein n=1 Tax=unclassified Tenacibaculum TaxID=2635139 RepID=UPI001F37DB17|nr:MULTISPECIES: hypothetical protein [unclassified Tenacibaculum]MCF2874487.1 hypothetical protein [Tenacibaculum sp. Cn5-1]MCF2934447.1 hypothetical protein [Tenacibaculum sp. Cn5-34]MCG7510657.1 hypothetical protein [Tenacibaculum sp. Cn5-46]
MSTQNDNFNIRNTFDMNTQRKHKSDLGLDIPSDYFSKSKQSILEQTVLEKKGKVVSLYKKISIWSAVAVVTLLFTLAVYNPIGTSSDEESDILIASLVTEEADVDKLLEDYVNDELLTDEIFSE